ncbi:MAG: nucleotidyltransferase [Saprospiraceae bacterium]|nr:nucleotidyltransferase [Saprospiraceae bacterium]
MKPTLLVLAAGMGSRYGKLKQMDGFGPNEETIIEYSLYDAIKAGFGKVVFVIRESFAEEFKAYFIPKLIGKIEVSFIYQETHMLPEKFDKCLDRQKPWGTAHAIWVAKNEINEPFGVINADDYYGTESYSILANFLKSQYESGSTDYAVVGYYLRNTLSEHGTVNRGICQKGENGFLASVRECIKIKREDDGVIRYVNGEDTSELDENSLVSMNMWGFLPSYFDYCEKLFVDFLNMEGEKPDAEFFIPKLIDHLIQNKILNVQVLDTESDWFGVTYQEDKPFVSEKINSLLEKGVYPSRLWNLE